MPLYTYEAGSPQNPAILFLHGGGAGGWMWQKQMDALQDEFYCLAPDLPEHGKSLETKPFSINGSAELAAELIRLKVPSKKAFVVGLSEGAQITVAMLAKFPELIERALISSALLRPMPAVAWMYTPGMAGVSYDLAIAPLKKNDGWIRLNMRSAAAIPDEYFPYFKETFQGQTREGFIHLMAENQAFRMPAGLERVRVPALVVAGKREYKAMLQSARDLVTTLPGAVGRLVSLGKGGSLAREHNWSMNAPELFTATVRAWVKSEPLPAELLPLG